MYGTVVLTAALILLAAQQDCQAQFSVTPEDILVNETQSATVQCAHNDSTSLSWQKVGRNTITDGSGGFRVSEDAEGVSSLTVVSAEPGLTGQYACVAALAGGAEEMALFNIAVQYIGPVELTVTLDPCAEDVVYLDNDVSLQCQQPEGAFPEVTSITWFRRIDANEQQLQESGRVHISADQQQLNITSIISTDTAEYFCRVSNDVFTRDSDEYMLSVFIRVPDRQLTLTYNGEVLERDQRLLVKEGTATRVHCFITPPSPPFSPNNVYWSRDSLTLVSGVTAHLFVRSGCEFILLIEETTSDVVGHYRCHLDPDHAGVILVLATIPATYSVTASPDHTVLGEGRQITFTCEESPPDQIHNVDEAITWQFRSSPEAEPQDVAGGGRFQVGERSLTVNQLYLNDSGTYFCVADHPLVTAIKTSVELQVEAAYPVTVTTENLPNPVVRLGTSLVLRCSVDAPRDVKFQWAVNSIPVTSSGRFQIESDPVSGTSILTITSVLLEDLGEARCTVLDPLHVPLSNTLTVTETGQLYLFGDQTSRVHQVGDGQAIRLECPIRSSTEDTRILWFTGSRLLTNSSGVSLYRLENGSAIAELGVASLAEDEGDQYVCQVREGAISLNYSITIYVTTPGNLSSFPPPFVNVTEGTRVQLDCEVTGRPLPTVEWFQGTRRVSELNNPMIIDVRNGSLVFESVRMADAGNYVCIVSNSSMSRATTLRVLADEGSSGVLGLNTEEAVLVFVVVGLVGIFLIIVCSALVVVGCYFCLSRRTTGQYMVSSKHDDSFDSNSFKQGSMHRSSLRKDNSGVLSSTHTPIFDTLQRSPDAPPPSTLDGRYDESNSIPMNSFIPGVGPAGSASLLTESHTSSPMRGTTFTTPSHNSMSSPLHGTVASTSIFSSEEHTTLENGMPNFPRNNVKLGELMGQGEFGPVMKAVARNLVPGEAETEVAVKLLVTETVEDTGFRADLAIMDYANQMKLEYRNIASILGICSDKEPYLVIYEYLDRGDLKNFLLSSRPEPGAPPRLMNHELLQMINQVADGMAYLFSQRIIHGDIATRNCLVSSSLQVKIGDLGIGHELYVGDYYDNGAQLLPIRWMPPELLTDSDDGVGPSFSLYSDAWSFGVFCWEVMAYARLPYDNYSDEEVLAMVPAGSRLRNPSPNCPPDLFLVMMDCWQEDPERRPQFNKILATLATINVE